MVISGKGGTGKTSITASLSYLAGEKAVIADCDVDAADMHLLLDPDQFVAKDFFSGELALIDQSRCTGCNICYDTCRFSAIINSNNIYSVDRIGCEGCGYCARVCPEGAIKMVEQKVGKLFISTTRLGNTMVHAKLGTGSENSGKLVAEVKKEARRISVEKNADYIIVDGSPGIGCPVVSSLSGADFVLLVTEPTVSGLHDLKRVYKLVEKFGIRAGCIINKADLNQDIARDIREFVEKENIVHIGNIPYDNSFTGALIEGKTVSEIRGSLPGKLISESWHKINETIK